MAVNFDKTQPLNYTPISPRDVYLYHRFKTHQFRNEYWCKILAKISSLIIMYQEKENDYSIGDFGEANYCLAYLIFLVLTSSYEKICKHLQHH